MGSVIATWTGRCADRSVQDELLSFIHVLAYGHKDLWDAYPEPVNRLSQKLHEHRRKGAHFVLADVRHFDETISGRVIVRSDIAGTHGLFLEEAARSRLVPRRNGPAAFVAEVPSVHIKGIDFRLFDPRGLYPGSDRVSFVFLSCPALAGLDGALVHVHGKRACETSDVAPIRRADGFLECPFIHLRYVMEDWMVQLMSWVKHFFVPDLRYRSHEGRSGYETWRPQYQVLEQTLGKRRALGKSFGNLELALSEESRHWVQVFRSPPFQT